MVSAALRPHLEVVAPAAESVSGRTEIAVRNVSVVYGSKQEGRKTVLAGLNLSINAGEFVVILGETGCGKSTLLRLILGQEFPNSGTVEVDGKPVRRIDSRCGYVPQRYSLFPDRTVLGNVMYGPENAHSRMLARLRPSFYRYRKALRAEATVYLERMGLRLQDMRKYPHQLSGGMQQRVAIAQALLMHPPVLLMDEAFSALDPSTRSRLQQQLHAIWSESKPTVVFVTHNTQEALSLGTRLILLGRHCEDGVRKSNVLLDMKLPTALIPFSRRTQSVEYRDLLECVKRTAFKHSSMNRDGELSDTSITEGQSE